jgi:hypothetical protein
MNSIEIQNTKIYRAVIFPVVLYGCETWSLTLKVFENTVLRKTFWPKRDEVAGEWRKLHNKELYDLYCSANIIQVNIQRRMRWEGHVARMGERRDAYMVFMGKPEEKRPL